MDAMKKFCLIVLDGFGMGDHGRGDAIAAAKKPFLDQLFQNFDPQKITQLKTHGRSVGLPEQQTGGSEAGHLTLGAGRPIKQLLTVIDDEIKAGDFEKNPVLVKLFEAAKQKKRIHFLGLVSDGGIHSYLSHLQGLQKLAKKYGIPKTYIHALTDGRDVGERSAIPFLETAEKGPAGKIASIGGRFFAMDRDANWDREKDAYDVFCHPETEPIDQSWKEYLEDFYQHSDKSDYYLPPALLEKEGQIQPDDVVIFFNFRSDRMRQIVQIMLDPGFQSFETPVKLQAQNVGIFGDYSDQAQKVYDLTADGVQKTLGEVVSDAGLRQLRISETEKFNHVTFFFSGERKNEFPGEERILIPSPKCPSYAEKPEMSAREQTDALVKKLETENNISLIVQNFANPDLVGHSGNLEAAKKAIEVVDACLAQELPVLQKSGYHVLICADHGNADNMVERDGKPAANHTQNPVPCVLRDPQGNQIKTRPKGTLADIAPTALEILELKKPDVMTGESLTA